MKARTVEGRGEEAGIRPLCDPGSELLLGTGKEGESSARIINGMKKRKRKNSPVSLLVFNAFS